MKGDLRVEELEMRVNQLEKQNTTMYGMIKTEMDLIETLNRRCNLLQECIEKMQSALLNNLDATSDIVDTLNEIEQRIGT